MTVDDILGAQTGNFVGYATSGPDRDKAASGGVVSAITRYLLEQNIVQGVLASRIDVEDGEISPRSIIARHPDELARCRNSIYLDFSLASQGRYRALIEELGETDHRIAVVGLFCHLNHLAQMMERHGIARERVLMIGLFCSHAPERVLLKQVLERQGAELDRAVAYHTKTGDGYRDGRLYGRSTLDYADGTKLDFPFIEFTAFKNAWFYTPKKCLACPDQFAEVADISCGDAWYKEIRAHRFKQTTIVTRTDEARDLLLRMVRDRALELRDVDPTSIVRSQRRVAGVEKAGLAARVKLAPWFGIKLPAATGRIRLRDLAHAGLMLAAVKISAYPRAMRLIMALPTPIILVFTLTVKLLEQSLLNGLAKGKGVGRVITGFEAETPAAQLRTPDAHHAAQRSS